jgi:hypothetical protein
MKKPAEAGFFLLAASQLLRCSCIAGVNSQFKGSEHLNMTPPISVMRILLYSMRLHSGNL